MSIQYINRAKDLLYKARRVKSGDIILPEDINTLVDIVDNIIKALQGIEIVVYGPLLLAVGESISPATPRSLPEAIAYRRYSIIYVEIDRLEESFIEITIF